MRNAVFHLCVFILCVMPVSGVYSEASEDAASQVPGWNSFETNYFKVYYKPGADLRGIERHLRKRWFYFREGQGYYGTDIESKAAYRLDMLFNKAQDILDMHPGVNKITIKIFDNRKELNNEYYKIFYVSQNFKSFYIHARKTIYTSEEDISDSIIIHEMGHAIVDHYFSVIPPSKAAEVLASYVDAHLED